MRPPARNGIAMMNLSFLFGVLLLVDVSPSGHVKTSEDPNMAEIEQFSGMNVLVALADGVKTVIVMEEDSLILNTSVSQIKRDDTILWMFGDDSSIIAKINEAAGMFSTKEDERFGDRLELNKQTGSLTIRNIRTEHTGLYQLKIKSTTETMKRFSVTVRELPKSSHWKITGPVLAVVVLILIGIVIGICIGIKMGCIEVSWPCGKRGNQWTHTPTRGEDANPKEQDLLPQGPKVGDSPTE